MVAGHGQVALDPVEHLVRGREAAGRLEHEQPVIGRPQDVQLAEGADVVEAGVGAGVGQEDETLVQSECEAVRHQGS